MDAFPVPRIGPTQTSESTGRRAYRYFHSCLVRHRGRVPENRVACAMRPRSVPHRRQTGRPHGGEAAPRGMTARTTPYIPGGLNLWVLNNLPNCGRSSQRRPSRSATRSGRQRRRTPARSRSPATSRSVPPAAAGGKAAHARSRLRRSRRRRSIRSSLRSESAFPRAFPKNPPKVPLKVGIWDDLAREAQAVGPSEAELREAMSTWCRGNRYWSCLVEDAVRVDLQGNEAGRVTHDDAAQPAA